MASTNGVREIRTRLSLDGETAFRKSLKSVDSSLSSMRSELKMVSTDFEESTNAMYKNQRKAEILTKMQDQLKVKIGALSDAVETSSKAYEEAKKKAEDLTAEYGENSDEAKTAWQEAEKLANKMDRMATMSNNAKTKLNDVTQQLRDVETSLEDAGDEAKKTVSKFDKLSSEISDQEGKLDSLKTSLTNAFLEYGDGSKEVMDLKYEISKLSSELDENKGQLSAAEKSVDEFTKSLEDAGDEANTASDKAKEAANDGFTVLKGAAADLVSDGLSKVYDSLRDVVTELGNADSVYNNFAIKTGASAADMEKYSESIMGLYKEGYGDSLSSISDGMAIVKQSMKDVPTDKLEEVTEYALTLEDAFGYDVAESMRAANSLVDQFGVSFSDAYDLIIQGAQNGLDQNGDLLDVINEYSVQFKNSGHDAEDMFNMLANGVATGVWSVDKLGDAWKEFNIRVSDGTADEALQALGLGFADANVNAEELQTAALNLTKAQNNLTTSELSLEKARVAAYESEIAYNNALSEFGENSLEAQKAQLAMQEAYNGITNAELAVQEAQNGISTAQANYNAVLGSTTYNLDEIKGKLASGGEAAEEAQQQIITALMSVEDENERYILGQQLMGTMWEDMGEEALSALFNTQGEISTTKDAMQDVIDLQYEDIGSKLEKVGRKAKTEIAEPLIKKYMPKIEKGIEWVSENLEDIIPTIETIGKVVVTAFAVKKVVEFGKTTINTIKSVKTAFTALNTSNPLGWIQIGVTAVTALGAAFIAAKKKSENYYKSIRDEAAKFSEKQQEIHDSISDTAEKWQDFTDNRSTMDDNVNTEFQKVSELKTALDGLVNADGTVKKGSEEEVRTILDSLSEYTGATLGISDGILTKNGEVITSYQALSTEIDTLLEKQHASALMAVYQEQYDEYTTERKQLLEDVTDAQTELRTVSEEIEALTTKQKYVYNGGSLPAEEQAELDGLRKKRDELLEVYAAGQDSLAEMAEFLTQYENATTAMSNGDYSIVIENMNKISAGFITANTANVGQLKKQYDEFAESYKEIVRLHKTNPGIYTEKDVEDAKKLMELAKNEYEKKSNEIIDISATTGREYIQGLAHSTISHSEKLTAARKYIKEKLANGEELKEIAKDLGISYDEALGTALKDGHVSVGSASNYLANTALNEFISLEPEFVKNGKLDMQSWIDGLKSGEPDAINAAKDLANSANVELWNTGADGSFRAGQYSGECYISGLQSAVDGLALDMGNGHSLWSPLAQFAAPHFAKGTDNFRGGFAVINENDKGELVNLPDGSQVIPHDISMKYAEEAAARGNIVNNSFGNINVQINNPSLSSGQDIHSTAEQLSESVISEIARRIEGQKRRYSSAVGR